MSVLGTGALTLPDWLSRTHDGKAQVIVELQTQTQEFWMDALMLEGNLPTGHKTTVRTGLPSGTWRLLNYGVQPTKSSTAQIVDTCGNLEDFGEVDVDLADLNGNTNEFRMGESKAHIQGLGQQVSDTFIYGDQSVNPERFTGLAPRYNALSGYAASANVINGGGSGSDNTSIWLVTWGPDTTHFIFPKGKTPWLAHNDMGKDVTTDAAGGRYIIYRDHFKWEIGLTVRDWRYNVRIANIDVSDLAGGSAADLVELMIDAMYKVPTLSGGTTGITSTDAPSISGMMGKTVFYCNRTIKNYLHKQARSNTNTLLNLSEIGGRPFLDLNGIPVRTVENILNTESALT